MFRRGAEESVCHVVDNVRATMVRTVHDVTARVAATAARTFHEEATVLGATTVRTLHVVDVAFAIAARTFHAVALVTSTVARTFQVDASVFVIEVSVPRTFQVVDAVLDTAWRTFQLDAEVLGTMRKRVAQLVAAVFGVMADRTAQGDTDVFTTGARVFHDVAEVFGGTEARTAQLVADVIGVTGVVIAARDDCSNVWCPACVRWMPSAIFGRASIENPPMYWRERAAAPALSWPMTDVCESAHVEDTYTVGIDAAAASIVSSAACTVVAVPSLRPPAMMRVSGPTVVMSPVLVE